MNGQVYGNSGTTTERVFRSHDRPAISVPELAAMQRGYLERLGTIVERLSTITRRPDEPTTLVNSPHADKTQSSRRKTGDVERGIPLAKLIRKTLANGAVAYSLPMSPLRTIVAKLIGANQTAFVHHGASSRSASIELVGKTRRDVIAAMSFAAGLWPIDEVTIRVAGKEARRIIEHAVAQKLNVAICDPYIESLVTEARQRHAVRARKADALRSIAVLEHVPADGSSR